LTIYRCTLRKNITDNFIIVQHKSAALALGTQTLVHLILSDRMSVKI